MTTAICRQEVARQLVADIAGREFDGLSVRTIVAMLRIALQEIVDGEKDHVPSSILYRGLDVILAEEGQRYAFERAIGRTVAADVTLFEGKSWLRLLTQRRSEGRLFDDHLERVCDDFREASQHLNTDLEGLQVLLQRVVEAQLVALDETDTRNAGTAPVLEGRALAS